MDFSYCSHKFLSVKVKNYVMCYIIFAAISYIILNRVSYFLTSLISTSRRMLNKESSRILPANY